MKKFFITAIVFGLLLCAVPAFATWTCQQGGTGCTVTTQRNCSGAASCNITVTSTHAGATLVLAGQFLSTTITLTGSGDGTWTTSTASHGTDALPIGVEIAYNTNATGGATTITCTFSASDVNNQCQFFEFTRSLSTTTFDTGNAVDTATCMSCAGVALTLGTANNYLLIQADTDGGSSSAIDQSYTGVFLNGNGLAYKMNVSTAGTTPNWTSTSGPIAGGAIAIYESGGGGSPSIGWFTQFVPPQDNIEIVVYRVWDFLLGLLIGGGYGKRKRVLVNSAIYSYRCLDRHECLAEVEHYIPIRMGKA